MHFHSAAFFFCKISLAVREKNAYNRIAEICTPRSKRRGTKENDYVEKKAVPGHERPIRAAG